MFITVQIGSKRSKSVVVPFDFHRGYALPLSALVNQNDFDSFGC